MKKVVVSLAFVAVVLLLLGQGNRLRLFDLDYINIGGSALIVDTERSLVVDANVTGYTILSNYIIGMRVVDTGQTSWRDVSPQYGYFVLNVLTGELEEGMCWHELVAYMAKKDMNINSFDRFVIDYL